MPRAKRPAPPSPLTGLKAKVMIERNGATVCVEDVEARDAFTVLAELLEAMRVATKHYPELTQELQPVGGGSIEYTDEDDWEGRRVGFK